MDKGAESAGGAPSGSRALPGRAGEEEPATLSLAGRFAGVLEAGGAIARALSRRAAVDAVREHALRLLSGERCAVLEVAAGAEAGGGQDLRMAAGDADAALSRALALRALAEGAPVSADATGAGASSAAAAAAGARSAIAAPIVAGGRAVAAFVVTHATLGGLFGARERALARFIASLAGAAFENAAALERVEALGRSLRAAVDGLGAANEEKRRLGAALARGYEEERRRLSLALHDGAGQVLVAVGHRLAALARREADAAVSVEARALGGLIAGLASDLRGLSHDLWPESLDPVGLGGGLADLAAAASTEGLAVVADVDGAPRSIPTDVAAALYRIAQAALANAAGHARARCVRLSLTEVSGAARLEVEDDGVGFDVAAARGAGLGLVGMRERAAWIGGRFEIESAPGRGTRIRVEAPLGRGARAAAAEEAPAP
jgi:signal transduction histidine kinase